MTTSARKVAVLGGNRIPFARQGGAYAKASNQDMLTASLEGLIARYGLAGQRLGEFAAGAVVKHSRDFNLARETVLGSSLDAHTPACDLQQACGTGLQAAIYISNKIALGQIDSGIAGGADTSSDAPLVISERLRKAILASSFAKSTAARAKALTSIRPADLMPAQPQNSEPRTGLSMGDHMAITAKKWGIGREAQDELAMNSHHNLADAYETGFFDDLMTGYLGLAKDANLRPESSLEKLGSLKPVFGKGDDDATMTAGNSTPLTDGASVVLLGSEEWAAEQGLPIQAYFVDAETAAVDYVHGDEGLLMAPAYAVPRLLARNGLTLQDFDYYEIHEAFAATVLSTLAAWEDQDFCRDTLGLDAPLGSIDRSRLNVNGSSLAAGHPFAATGGRIVASLAKMLHAKGPGSRGLISICAAGGQGVVAILEGA